MAVGHRVDTGGVLVTNHVLSGAFVGRAAPGPVSAFAAGVASHFALDAVPHWGNGKPIGEVMHVAVPDGLLGLAAMATVTATTEPGGPAAGAGRAWPGRPSPTSTSPPCGSSAARPSRPGGTPSTMAVQRESAGRMPQEILVGLGQAAVLAPRRAPDPAVPVAARSLTRSGPGAPARR